MLISTRQACLRLDQGCGLSRRQGLRVLAAGFAGEPVDVGSTVLYDSDTVDALAAWPVLDDEAVDAVCPHGLFIARRDVRFGAPWGESADTISPAWPLNVWPGIWFSLTVEEHGHLPVIATVCGFVAFGAEVTDLGGQGAETVLGLRPPGPWFARFEGRQVLAGPGRPWVLRGFRPLTSTMGQSLRQHRPHRQEPA